MLSLLLHPIPTSLAFIQCTLAKRSAIAAYATSASSSLPKKTTNTLSFSFSRYGFSVAQAKAIMRTNPWFLSTEPEKTIEPKLDFLLSYGFSREKLIELICHDPAILCTSLASRITPNLIILERLLGTKPHVMKVCIRGPWLLRNDLRKTVLPIMTELQVFGIPNNRIVQMVTNNPLVLSQPVSVITETLNKLKELGMNPNTLTFASGLTAMVVMKKTTWERKMQLYMSFGWSEKDFFLAFARQPTCMMISDDKINKMMGFFMNTLNWDTAKLVKRVALLTVSLENRIIPRCAVMEVLDKEGLWDGKPILYTLLCISEKQFEGRFIENYKDKVPGLYDAYIGKTQFSGFASAKMRSNYMLSGIVK